VIKFIASNHLLCQWMSNQRCIFAGFDGCSYETQRFMEFHLIGVDRSSNVSKQCLRVSELYTSTTGVEVAGIFCNSIDNLAKCAITTLYQ